MRSIYIVFSHSGTLVSRIIKLFSHEKYSHVSLSFDESCEHMYSFGRKYSYIAFIGCFNTENIREGLYKTHKNSKMAIYKLEEKNLEEILKDRQVLTTKSDAELKKSLDNLGFAYEYNNNE